MKRVLFVDDEPFVLEGLRNVLHKQRKVWDMSFLGSGQEALQALAEQPHDALVTDMRMPGMDGADLLQQVRERYPATARVILTGQSGKDDLIRALPIAHQILTKPCDPPTLAAVLERLFKVQALLGNDRLRALVGGVERLPSFPKCYQYLSEAMQRDYVADEEINRIVQGDPALSVTVLTMANSAYFGLSRPTTSIPMAIRHIGFQLLRSLALSSAIFGRMDASLLRSRTIRQLPDSSLLKAQLARQLVRDRTRADDAFAAGLLLNVGYIVLAQGQTDSYLSLLDRSESSGQPIHEIERECLGITHAEAGAYLLGVWGLPAQLVDLVACHHLPDWPAAPPDPLGVAVHAADVFGDAIVAGQSDLSAGLAPSFRDRVDVRDHLADWQSLAEQAAGSR